MKQYTKGDLLKHCNGFDILVMADLGAYLLYSKESSNGLYEYLDLWIRPKEMFYDEHSSGVPRFKFVESLSEDEIKYIDKYAEYKKSEASIFFLLRLRNLSQLLSFLAAIKGKSL